MLLLLWISIYNKLSYLLILIIVWVIYIYIYIYNFGYSDEQFVMGLDCLINGL